MSSGSNKPSLSYAQLAQGNKASNNQTPATNTQQPVVPVASQTQQPPSAPQVGGKGSSGPAQTGSGAPLNSRPPSQGPKGGSASGSTGAPPLNFAAAAAASAAKNAAPMSAEKQTHADILPEGSSKGPQAAKAPGGETPSQNLSQKTQGQGRFPGAWATGDGLTFKSNVLPPAQSVSTKVRFGSQSEIEEGGSQTVPAGESNGGSPAPPASSNFEGVQPLAPTPVHMRSSFTPNIPRTVSAPPQLDKLKANPSKGSNQSALASQPPTNAPEEASAPTSNAGYVGGNASGHPQLVHQPAVPNQHIPHSTTPPVQHHVVAQPPQPHHPNFTPSGPQNPTHFPGAPIPPPSAQFHPPPGPHPQPHYNAGRPHMRPPIASIPPQPIIPGQFNGKPSFKGNQYNQSNQAGGAMPTHPASIPQVPVGPVPAAPFYSYAPYAYPYDPAAAAYGVYGQPQYFPPAQVPFPQQPLMRPPVGGAGVPPAQQRYPQQPSQAPPPYTPPPITPAKTSKAIRIVNPVTKEDVVISKAIVSAPAAATPAAKPEVVKEKTPVPVTVKDPKGNKIELKSPTKAPEKPLETAQPVEVAAPTEQEAQEAPESVQAAVTVAPEVLKSEEVEQPTPAETTEEPTAGDPEEELPDAGDASDAAVPETEVTSDGSKAAFPSVPKAALEGQTPEVPVESTEKPAIIVSAASEENLVKDEATKEPTSKEQDLEEGEIPEAKTEASEKKDVKEAKPDASVKKAENKPRVEPRVLHSFEGLQYPDGVKPPAVIAGRKTYPKEFLMLYTIIKYRPDGLPGPEVFTDDGKQQSPRTSRPASGSGSGFSGSAAHSGHATPKRQNQPGSFHVKGIMPTVAAPPSSRPIASRNSVGPGAGLGFGGSGSARGSQGSWDSKGNQGLPPRPGAGRGRDRQPQYQPPEPPVEALKVGQNAWVPEVRRAGPAKAGTDEEQAAELLEAQTVKKAKGLLNKLTIEKFDTISDQFLALPITTQSLLKKVIELIFDKALDEHHFQNMYGRLCQKLSNELPKVQKWIDMDTKNNIFRRLLLNKCQEEFEKSEKWSASDAAGEMSRKERLQRLNEMSSEEKAQYAEDEFQRSKLKRRVLGNITFIGELFKLAMITEKIMHLCVKQLLAKVVDPEEEETECLCKLLKSVGESLDRPEAKQHMNVYFARIKDLSVNQKLPSRIRFMLQDLIEQRKNNWKARIEVTGPMTIAEIHEREERKQREEEEAIKQRNAASRGGKGGRGGPPYRQGSVGGAKTQDSRGGAADGGWNTVAERNRSSRQVEDNLNNFGKVDMRKPPGSMHFGPPTASTWSRGAQGGATRDDTDKSAARTGGSANIFSVLSGSAEPERKKSVEIPRSTTPTSTETSTKAERSTSVGPQKLTKNQAMKKIDSAAEEWFSIFDQSEFAAIQKELGTDEYNQDLVSKVLTDSLDKKPEQIRKTADLLNYLVKESVVSMVDVIGSIKDVIEILDDMSIDVPGVYRHMGTYFSRLLVLESEELSLETMVTLLEPVIETKARIPEVPKLLAETFICFKANEGEDFASKYLRENNVDLRRFWPSDRRSDEIVAEWMESNGLMFLNPLMKDDIVAIEAENELGFLRVVALSLLRYLGQKTIFANGVKNPLELSREHFVKQEEILTAHKSLLTEFMGSARDQKELEILFACQEYWADCEKLKSFLEHLFRILLKIKLVKEDALNSWKANSTRLQVSKKAAMEELAGWFKSIKLVA
ncbi:hypothetical protein HDU96_006151 [Phlyctochytrium bullatum]|nr:hypothetical protein HDU96_006151 [Phlyctochytrium bullatum]